VCSLHHDFTLCAQKQPSEESQLCLCNSLSIRLGQLSKFYSNTTLHDTILYYTVLYYTILYYTILHYYNIILYYTILYYAVLYYTTIHYTTP